MARRGKRFWARGTRSFGAWLLACAAISSARADPPAATARYAWVDARRYLTESADGRAARLQLRKKYDELMHSLDLEQGALNDLHERAAKEPDDGPLHQELRRHGEKMQQ